MDTKKPTLLNPGHTDEMQTPGYAIKPLLPHIPSGSTIWEAAPGRGYLIRALQEAGFSVISDNNDFLSTVPWGKMAIGCDCIITNPPYTIKDAFLKHCYELGKPFALLMPLTALEGIKRGALYRKHGIELIIPNRRINFITPNGGKSSWFATAWFCWKFDLPQQLNFVELDRKGTE